MGEEREAMTARESADLQTNANELLRRLNRDVFNDAIDIFKLPYAVGLVEDFAKAYAKHVREQALEEAADEARKFNLYAAATIEALKGKHL